MTIKDPISGSIVTADAVASEKIPDGVLHIVRYKAATSAEVDCEFAVIERSDGLSCQSDWQTAAATPDSVDDYGWLDCTPDGTPEECSITEAAEMLGVSRQRVHQLIKSGAIDARKVGNAWCVNVASVMRRVR